ncbi:formate-dependent phosphoribosylglycinamide formyltransferase [Corynebacterium sp. CCM 9185]|uniref:Formate-dependent phosphoribosylglycinamide formyltransferase n=1 Tax=Corynebacterium marambiense TaxID=2765364 RepID=A0ABS0W0B7_9CORY|nr:formate-dependent phosphoribosylglycinamide formyltransferase [Corynebacterium marambiense]MBI9001325.1 formate-dependent phosphoribosylglycinamide formyltransferase [Corynebacterium marambiense]MCK7663880.1 formate-dependent phosphoribosylglycinamide formyltransferase [Corynebacterium marambiense]MCX7543029.1 formate-dependent phosphoribosylglycinamide formyltransferase [Corynebacterium marambiense]
MYTPDMIGTPQSGSATRVLLLGAGELGKEVTIAFQRLGVEVHAADRYDGAPAGQVAHSHHTLDMTDATAVRALVDEVRPHFIVPEIEALATDALAEIEEAGIATVVPTARATRLTMNREGIRRLAAEELGLPTSSYTFASSYAEFVDAVAAMGYPCVVKPVMSSSGKGQSVIRGADEVDRAWEHARTAARVTSDRVIVEGFVEFDYEITLLTVRSTDPATGNPATWFCEPIGHRQQDGDYVESWQPMQMSPAAADNARSVAARITNALGGRGVFGVELFVLGDDVYFSEVSPRPHDTGMVTMASQRFSEFDLHARAILGLPIDVTLISPGASAVIYGGVDAPAVSYSGLGAALAVAEADVRIFGKPEAFTRRRMGVALATAEDTDTARERATAAAAAVEVHATSDRH